MRGDDAEMHVNEVAAQGAIHARVRHPNRGIAAMGGAL